MLKRVPAQAGPDGDRRRRVRRHRRPGDASRTCSRRSSARFATSTTSRPSRSSRRAAAPSCSAPRSTSTRSRERLDVEIERDGFETVGGYVLTRVGRVPAVGETFELDGLNVEVLEAERRRIHKVRVRRATAPTPASKAEALTHEDRLSSRSSAGRTPASRRSSTASSARRWRSSRTSRRRRGTASSAVKNYDDGQAGVRRHAGHPPAAASPERADGGRRGRDAPRGRRRRADVRRLDPSGHGDEYVSACSRDVKVPVVLVLNKVDLVGKARLLPLIESVQAMARLRAPSCRSRPRPATASSSSSS